MAKLTERAIMKTFLHLLESKSMDKITVKDIIEEVGINRNTFYYHYEDIYDLIDAIFHEEMKSVVAEIKDRTDSYEVMKRSAQILLENKDAIIHLYQSKSRDVINKYLEKVSNVFLENMVRKAAEGTELSEGGVKFITYYYASATISHTLNWIDKGMPAYNEDFIKVMATSFDATIDDMIRNYIEQSR